MPQCSEVKFKTLDGLTLHGTLYLSSEPHGPAVLMTPGTLYGLVQLLTISLFNTTKEMFLPKVAQYFQQAGISALVYDPRTVGASEGLPRNNIVPAQQVSDYSDALTFLRLQPRVDPRRIALWGFSFSGSIALSAAALDKRACSVVAVCPLTVWELDEKKWRGVMARCMQDRESQLNGGNVPFAIPMVNSSGQNPAGFGSGVGRGELELIRESKDKVPGFEDTTTIQTYWHLMSWGGPFASLKWLQGTPVLVVTPEDDRISPAHKQKELIFDAIPELEGADDSDGEPRKAFHLVNARGHMDVLDGDSFREVMDKQVRFLKTWAGS